MLKRVRSSPALIVAAIAGTALWSSACLAPPVDADGLTDTPSRLEEKAAVLAPFSFIKLCHDHPDQCDTKAGASEIVLNQKNLQRLETINATVNHAIRPSRDMPGRDRWSLGVDRGDCEEYALAKRRDLVRIGIPARAVRLAVGTTSAGEPHAVVVVKTDKGDMALDNRGDKLEAVDRLDMSWSKIESADNPKLWRAL